MTAQDWKDLLLAANPILLAVVAYMQSKKTSEVKREVRETKGNTEAIHTLVNGQSTAKDGEIAQYARRIAELTGRADDVRTAEIKEQAYLDKQAAQQRSTPKETP